MIECNSIKGGKVMIAEDKLVFRPSVYAVIVNEGRILMLNTKSNGKYFFPGGGQNIGETLPEALRREVREEVGLEIEIGKLIHFKEQFFYYDPHDEAYHMLSFFYECKALTLDLLSDDSVDDEESEKPRWVDLNELRQTNNNIEAVDEVLCLLQEYER
ncbi:NUDIX domain-containing protein [Candidatus Falkowbacteria bacterium]|nr:NUDIX domain-containing protein [Candidatus Falkowbacteria bacterium]